MKTYRIDFGRIAPVMISFFDAFDLNRPGNVFGQNPPRTDLLSFSVFAIDGDADGAFADG